MTDKTLAELHDLGEHDPWATTPPQPPSEDTLEKRIHDRLQREGHFDKPAFADPPTDDDPTINIESSLSLVWRLAVRDHRVIDVYKLQPSIEKLALTYKNTSTGCWMAFTGKRVAQRIEIVLKDAGMTTYLDTCDIKPLATNVAHPDLIDPANFFYAITQRNGHLRVIFVPTAHWNEQGHLYDGDMGLIVLEKRAHWLRMVESYAFESSRDIYETKAFLDHHGFRENLLFQAAIN